MKVQGMISRFLSVVVMLVPIAGGVAAQDYDRDVEAYYAGDFALALREFEPLARQGHADAQRWLTDRGRGVPGDRAEAVTWYRQAAEQDHPGF